MIRVLAILILPALAGCGLDKIAAPDKPSAFQQHMERLALVTLPEPEVAAAEVVEPAPEPMPEVIIVAELVEPVAVCVPVFRVVVCEE